ncbi:hypothetical protein Bbelb_209380 [Branchiostoma belcheri]|nr:hypothetical protein Bbelb_209380 [Branchiostoma belcheri]
MGRKLRHVLIFLLIILKEPNMPEADCSCASSENCTCIDMGLTSIPQNLPSSLSCLNLERNCITAVNQALMRRRRTRDPPPGLNLNASGGNMNNSQAIMTSFHDHQYEDIDNQRGQYQTNSESTPQNTATMTSVEDHQYEDIDNHRDHTRQGQSQANIRPLSLKALAHSKVLAALTPNTMYPGVQIPPKDPTSTSSRSQTGQILSQVIIESNTNATGSLMASGHDQTGQGQPQADIDLSRKIGDVPHTKVLPNAMYMYSYAAAEIPPNDPAYTNVTTGYEALKGLSQATGSLDAGNLSYSTELTTPKPNSLYKNVEEP